MNGSCRSNTAINQSCTLIWKTVLPWVEMVSKNSTSTTPKWLHCVDVQNGLDSWREKVQGKAKFTYWCGSPAGWCSLLLNQGEECLHLSRSLEAQPYSHPPGSKAPRSKKKINVMTGIWCILPTPYRKHLSKLHQNKFIRTLIFHTILRS